MSLMKFVRDPQTAVQDFLGGLKIAYPALTVDVTKRIVINNLICEKQVCLLSGGGSGHEPFAAGFVGNGMLSGAVAGLIFTSPPSDTILDAICALAEINDNGGVLIIQFNYTGDVLNFGSAAESAKARNINVEIVIVDDDCSRRGSEVQSAGKRGMAGTCLVFKIGGSMAKRGSSLSDIAKECRLVTSKVATFGVTLTACTIPGHGPHFKINEGEMDLGIGIHGEAGVLRTKFMHIEELAEKMLSEIIETLNLKSGDRICVLINNLGSVSYTEMGIISSVICDNLTAKRKLDIARLYCGPYVTSLDMAGFQISILDITDNSHWLEHLDDETDAPAWTGVKPSISLIDPSCAVVIKDYSNELISKEGPTFTISEQALFKNCLVAMANAIISAESKLNELDSKSGDGDAGSTFKRLGEGIVKDLSKFELEYPAVAFFQISKIAQNVMGGTSGALYSILLGAVSKELRTASQVDWVAVGATSIDVLLKYSQAKVGDRTMVDALVPAFEEFTKQKKDNENGSNACAAALQVAKAKCEETMNMRAKLGRASYVPPEIIFDVDPGAYGVTVWLNALCQTLQSS